MARLAEADWTPWLIVGFAALLRFFLLGMKPPHFDEGINGWFVDQMVKNGFYKYDPTNYHGPLHFYVLFLFQTLFGRNLWALRLPVVLSSITCVWFALKFEPFLGRNVARVAALAMAVSTGFVFYGRYSIHEVWLVLFSMLFIYGLLGLWRYGTHKNLWCAGMGLTGMILTKETYIIHAGCALIALGVCYISNWLHPVREGAAPVKQTWDYADLAFVSATGLFAIIFFYSGTFFNLPEFSADGMKQFWKTFTKVFQAWFDTGTDGHGHEKPPYYWLMLLTRYEWTILAGLLLGLFCQRFENIHLRYLAIYGVGTLIAYSIVKYKTPWCIISIVWPLLFVFGGAATLAPMRLPDRIYAAGGFALFVLLGGTIIYARSEDFHYAWPFALILGTAALLVILRDRAATYIMMATLLVGSLGLSIWLNYFRCTTDTEPYVYVQTYNDVDKLTRPVLALARRNPIFYQMKGHLIRQSSYPLPWILGDFPNVGYYEQKNAPPTMDGDFLLVQEDRIKEVEEKLSKSYFTEPLTIRPYQDTSKVYFEANRFKDFFRGRLPDFPGKGPG
jgi:uncharacterized protein (TIGR03663 family)